MSDEATSKRELAIANFFTAATELLKLCKPLVEKAVKQNIDDTVSKAVPRSHNAR